MLVLWDRQNQPALDVDVYYVDRAAVAQLLDYLRAACPELQVERDVQRYLERA